MNFRRKIIEMKYRGQLDIILSMPFFGAGLFFGLNFMYHGSWIYGVIALVVIIIGALQLVKGLETEKCGLYLLKKEPQP